MASEEKMDQFEVSKEGYGWGGCVDGRYGYVDVLYEILWPSVPLPVGIGHGWFKQFFVSC